jgi:hypothetical protein
MFKSTLIIASAAGALALLTSQAQAMSCTQAEMTKMDTEMSKMTDTTKKEGAMKEMAMAKEMMAKKDDTACVTHMTNAQKMMPGM